MRNKHYYEEILKEKMDALPSPNADALWSRMNNILDAEMPVRAPKRAFPFSAYNTIALAGLAVITTLLIINANPNTKQSNIEATNKTETSITNTSTQTNQTTIQNNIPTISDQSNIPFISTGTPKPTAPFFIAANNANEKTASFVAVANHETFLPGLSHNLASNTQRSLLDARVNAASITVGANGEIATPFLTKAAPDYSRQNAWMTKLTIGLSMNMTVPVAGQKMNYYNSSNKTGILYDYLPSVYVQYPLSKKTYLQAEVQVVSPQYASGNLLYKKSEELNPDETIDDQFRLNKMYYLNLPVTLHFKPTENVSIGAGVQYSQLKHMVVSKEQVYSVRSGTGWKQVITSKETNLLSVPNAAEKVNAQTATDTVAHAFKKQDVRLVLDAAYSVDKVSMGIRYTSGLTPTYDSKESPIALPSLPKNTSVQVYLKYNLFGKKK